MMLPVCLIAEDSLPITQHLRKYAELCGFQVVHATEGESVLDLTRSAPPTFVLLNASLPGRVRGWEVLRLLKSDKRTRQIPIVTYCVNDEDEDFPALDVADAYFRMPVLYGGFRQLLMRAGVPLTRNDHTVSLSSERRCPKRHLTPEE